MLMRPMRHYQRAIGAGVSALLSAFLLVVTFSLAFGDLSDSVRQRQRLRQMRTARPDCESGYTTDPELQHLTELAQSRHVQYPLLVSLLPESISTAPTSEPQEALVSAGGSEPTECGLSSRAARAPPAV